MRTELQQYPFSRIEDIPELKGADLAEASAFERQLLYVAFLILKNNDAADSPFEGLVRELLLNYSRGEIGPETVDAEVQEFHQSFRSTKAGVEKFLRRYPKLFAAGAPEEAPCDVRCTGGAQESARFKRKNGGPISAA